MRCSTPSSLSQVSRRRSEREVLLCHILYCINVHIYRDAGARGRYSYVTYHIIYLYISIYLSIYLSYLSIYRHIYVCMYVCMYVCIHIFQYVYIYIAGKRRLRCGGHGKEFQAKMRLINAGLCFDRFLFFVFLLSTE
jgi:hypothetical protein